MVGGGALQRCCYCGLLRMAWASEGCCVDCPCRALVYGLVDRRKLSSSLELHHQRLLMLQLVEVVGDGGRHNVWLVGPVLGHLWLTHT